MVFHFPPRLDSGEEEKDITRGSTGRKKVWLRLRVEPEGGGGGGGRVIGR